MSVLARALGALVGICVFTWVAVIWTWQRDRHDISTQDIAAYLIILPAVLAVISLLVWRGYVAAQRKASAGAPASAAPAQPSSDSSVATREEPPSPTHSLRLASYATVLCSGDDAAASAEALRSAQPPLPKLDPHLKDDAGFPVFSGRVIALDDEEAAAEVAVEHGEDTRPPWPENAAVARSVAASMQVIAQAVADEAARYTTGEADRSGRGSADNTVDAPAWLITALWPAHWSAKDHALGNAWVEHATHAALAGERHRLQWLPMPEGASENECWDALGRQWRDWSTAHDPSSREAARRWLLVAAHSDIDPARVAALARSGELHCGTNRKGRMPGEGAAALVLSNEPLSSDAGASVLRVTPPEWRRLNGDEAAGAARVTNVCIDGALLAAGLSAAEVGHVISDADRHRDHSRAVFTVAIDRFPAIDPGSDVLLAGAAHGDLDVASTVAHIALAANLAETAPCLVLRTTSEHLRLATVVYRSTAHDSTPAPAPEAPDEPHST